MITKDMIEPRDRYLLINYAKNDMSPSKTATDSYMCTSSVHYRLNRVYRMTGLNPSKFFDLVKLLEVIGYHGEAIRDAT